MSKGFTIAIDGPVAAGKGTIAAKLARNLGGFYLYTGAMYRCIALECLKQGLNIENHADVESVLPKTDIHFEGEKIFLNGQDVTERIKEKDVAEGSSIVAVLPKVRHMLVAKQRKIAEKAIDKGKIVVSEGRDTGTIVFPDAVFKLYLTATDKVRAQRRFKQYQEKGNRNRTYEQVLEEIRERDQRDTEREMDPLPLNPKELGYVVLDDSLMTEDQTFEAIKSELRKRNLIND